MITRSTAREVAVVRERPSSTRALECALGLLAILSAIGIGIAR
ncbi:MAG TPA: hypothetical protein VFX74_07345 [Candidatus Limnocylindria bacterium]|nr:hypothetical protein [Candidatus Limnocylindria bacterium]